MKQISLENQPLVYNNIQRLESKSPASFIKLRTYFPIESS